MDADLPGRGETCSRHEVTTAFVWSRRSLGDHAIDKRPIDTGIPILFCNPGILNKTKKTIQFQF